MATITLAESVMLYENSYGSAIRLKRKYLISIGIVLCLVTPCTNWICPILPKLFKKDIRIRYERK